MKKRNLRYTILFYWLIFCQISIAQVIPEPEIEDSDSLEIEYYLIDGDTIPRESIDLDEVIVFGKLKFKSEAHRRRYLILRRKTRKVWPYAKLAADRLVELNERLDSMQGRRAKKRYTKIIQRYVEDEFTDELKKLTRTEGQILVKLIHRQTGITTFDLIKEYRSGWKAFWLNTTASLFDISLKEEYNPAEVEIDFLIEDILQRSFQAHVLDQQPSALDLNYFELSEKWTANVPQSGIK